MNSPIFDCDKDTVANCFGLIERGMRRLGLDPTAAVSRAIIRTSIGREAAERVENRKACVIARRGSYLISEHEIARIVALKNEGRRQHEIAADIGCSQGTVAKHLGKLGFHKRPGRRAMAA